MGKAVKDNESDARETLQPRIIISCRPQTQKPRQLLVERVPEHFQVRFVMHNMQNMQNNS